MKINPLFLLFAFLTICSCNSIKNENTVYQPVIISDWWKITGNPDLGEYTSENQEPVDFGVCRPSHTRSADYQGTSNLSLP